PGDMMEDGMLDSHSSWGAVPPSKIDLRARQFIPPPFGTFIRGATATARITTGEDPTWRMDVEARLPGEMAALGDRMLGF
ncbi:MAG: hypothetical protein M0Z36_12110, partial [Thermaerobacter sp.]|nr:hypothetical protein [Thermaerobacter sp.]